MVRSTFFLFLTMLSGVAIPMYHSCEVDPQQLQSSTEYRHDSDNGELFKALQPSEQGRSFENNFKLIKFALKNGTQVCAQDGDGNTILNATKFSTSDLFLTLFCVIEHFQEQLVLEIEQEKLNKTALKSTLAALCLLRRASIPKPVVQMILLGDSTLARTVALVMLSRAQHSLAPESDVHHRRHHYTSFEYPVREKLYEMLREKINVFIDLHYLCLPELIKIKMNNLGRNYPDIADPLNDIFKVILLEPISRLLAVKNKLNNTAHDEAMAKSIAIEDYLVDGAYIKPDYKTFEPFLKPMKAECLCLLLLDSMQQVDSSESWEKKCQKILGILEATHEQIKCLNFQMNQQNIFPPN